MNKFDYILSIYTYILELVVGILAGSSANLFNSPTVPAMYKSFFVTGILIRSLIQDTVRSSQRGLYHIM
jgi:hypothetical protein